MKRRHLLELVGRSGGAAAIFMRGIDLQAPDPTSLAPAGRAPAGTRVLALGAGLSRLTATYELQELGYDCQVLEARERRDAG